MANVRQPANRLVAMARMRLLRRPFLDEAAMREHEERGDIVTWADGTLIIISIGHTRADGTWQSLIRLG